MGKNKDKSKNNCQAGRGSGHIPGITQPQADCSMAGSNKKNNI